MTTMTAPHHQVATATAHMRGIADGVVDASVWSMTAPETAVTLVELTRLEAQVVELKTRVAAHADEVQVGTETGATSTANWWAHQTRQTRQAAYRTVRLGYDLATHDHVRDALAHGDLVLDQADVIIRAVKALPGDLDPDLLIKAERHLVDLAREHDARALTILGRRLLDVVAPERADQHESDLLEKEEAKAAQAARLTMTDDGHGKLHGRFTLPVLQAAELKKMLLALAAPKHLAATHGPGVERRPGPERMGRAFMELIDRISARDLPRSGAATPPSSSRSTSTPSWAAWRKQGSSTPANTSPPAPPGGSPAKPASSPSCSAQTPRFSTSDADNGSSPKPRPPP